MKAKIELGKSSTSKMVEWHSGMSQTLASGDLGSNSDCCLHSANQLL